MVEGGAGEGEEVPSVPDAINSLLAEQTLSRRLAVTKV
jgi:hypothetical protein